MRVQVLAVMVVRMGVDGPVGVRMEMRVGLPAESTPERPGGIGQTEPDHQPRRDLSACRLQPGQPVERDPQEYAEGPDEHRRGDVRQAAGAGHPECAPKRPPARPAQNDERNRMVHPDQGVERGERGGGAEQQRDGAIRKGEHQCGGQEAP